ncbi:hypothetical protein PVAP13_9KG373004 [Panicum virgatum]|uniref:Uncharacterized protein n=1 Tax=Panicum virgatum TaxID=38727 RepID=A0A8T0NSA7_PANVG|nr:hypothetical protein PVAP13_9KG373004 [Panicum virgatum]
MTTTPHPCRRWKTTAAASMKLTTTESATSKTESATSSTKAGTNSTESATSRTESATSSTEYAATSMSSVTGEHVLGERLIRVCEHQRRAVIELPAGIHGGAWPSEMERGSTGCAWRRSAREAHDQCARERNEESRPTRDINATACMREWNRMDRGNRVKPVSHAARTSTFEKTHM